MSHTPSPDEIPEVISASETKRPRRVCSYCGSDDITKGLALGLSHTGGQVGIKFESTGGFLGFGLLMTEPLFMNLCNACGTVIRIYVKETDRKWS